MLFVISWQGNNDVIHGMTSLCGSVIIGQCSRPRETRSRQLLVLAKFRRLLIMAEKTEEDDQSYIRNADGQRLFVRSWVPSGDPE